MDLSLKIQRIEIWLSKAKDPWRWIPLSRLFSNGNSPVTNSFLFLLWNFFSSRNQFKRTSTILHSAPNLFVVYQRLKSSLNYLKLGKKKEIANALTQTDENLQFSTVTRELSGKKLTMKLLKWNPIQVLFWRSLIESLY